MLSPDNGIVVTITGNIYAPLNQIFGGEGTISFAGNYRLKEAYPEWWGAIADDSIDDTSQINACFTAAGTGEISVKFNNGTYKFSDTITFPYNAGNLDMENCLMSFTALNTTYTTAIVIGDSTGVNSFMRKYFKGINVQRLNVSDHSNEACIGIQIFNSYNSTIDVKDIRFFTIGLQLIGKPSASNSNASAYNKILPEILTTNKIGIDLNVAADNGVYTAYCNENTIIGGRFAGSTSASHNTLDRYGIRISKSVSATIAVLDGNKIIGSSFEMGAPSTSGSAIGIKCEYGRYNRIIAIRSESNDYTAQYENDSYGNKLTVAYGTIAINDLSTRPGLNVTQYAYNAMWSYLKPVFQSGNLNEKAIFYNGSANMSIGYPMFLAYYSSVTRVTNRAGWNITTSGIKYVTGTYDGIGIRIDTSNAKTFFVDWAGDTNTEVYFIPYDVNGSVIDADAGSYVLSATPTSAIAKIANFVTAGKSYYFSASAGQRGITCHADVQFVDIIIAVDNNETLKSFSVYTPEPYDVPVIYPFYDNLGAGNSFGTTSPTKGAERSWYVGKKVWNATPASAQYIGWVCVNKKDTTLTDGEPISETVMVVGSSSTMVALDIIGIALDDGTIHWTTIASVDSGTQITLTVGLPSAAGATKAVYTNRWLGFGLIA